MAALGIFVQAMPCSRADGRRLPEPQLLALARVRAGLAWVLPTVGDGRDVGRGDVSSAFLAGVAAADECLVAELGGDVLATCTGAAGAMGAMGAVRCTGTSGAQVRCTGEQVPRAGEPVPWTRVQVPDAASSASLEEARPGEQGTNARAQRAGALVAPVPRTSAPVRVTCSPSALAWGERALAVIRREFAAVRSVRQLARRLHCHPVYLARTFRQALDIPVSDYLAAFKVGVAFRLLTDTELKICAIPDVAGFGGKATLYRNVHRLTGHTPGYWRLVRQRAAALDHRARASLRIVEYPSSVTARARLANVRSDRDVSFEGGPGVCEPDLAGPWTVPRAVATLMRPLSMRDPPC